MCYGVAHVPILDFVDKVRLKVLKSLLLNIHIWMFLLKLKEEFYPQTFGLVIHMRITEAANKRHH